MVETQPVTPARPWWADRWSASAAMWVCSAVSLLVGIGQLTIRGAVFGLDEYDDGVYFGSAVRLAQGHLPYRSFVFPHPPGITLLLLPLGLIGRFTSTRITFGLIRILTTLVAAAVVFLVGWLLRHRGVIAVLAGGLSLATYPLASAATKSVLLEPYVLLAVLGGAALLFRDGRTVDGRRLVWAGVLFGFAGAIKLWAAMPIAAVLVCCAVAWHADRARWRRFGGGWLAGFVVPCAPFFLAAPGRFLHQVVSLQLQRSAASGGLPTRHRIVLIAGTRVLPEMRGAAGWSVALLLLVVAAIMISLLVRPLPEHLDVFAIAAALASLAAVLKLSDFFTHYGYFTAGFLALAGGAAAGRLTHAGLGLWRGRVVAQSAVAAALAVLVVLAGGIAIARSRGILHRWPDLVTTGDVGPAIARLVPEGVCALSDDPSLLLTSNRLVGGRGCPSLIDPYYAWLAEAPAHPVQGIPPERLVAAWQGWMERSDYVVLSMNPARVPWTPDLSNWFSANYEYVGGNNFTVFRHRR